MGSNSITFFFPYPYISGIPVLFSNVTNYLLDNSDMDIFIIDYKDGALAQNCKPHPRLTHIVFKDFEECRIDFETKLVLQAGLPYRLRPELVIGNKVRILEWAAFEYNLVPYLFQIGFIKKLQEKYFWFYRIFRKLDGKNAVSLSEWTNTLINRGSILFMTRIIYETTRKYLELPPARQVTYLPNLGSGITCYDKTVLQQKSVEAAQCLELAWVGRIADFKISILNYSLQKISEAAAKNKISVNFHVIGDGEFMSQLDESCQHDFFRIINTGRLGKAEVDRYLQDKIHALFAMGTSALDGARIGLPVVLLDFSYSRISKDYRFRYLFNTTGFDLGHPVREEDFETGNNSCSEIINELVSQYDHLSNQTYTYFENNHSTDKITARLLAFFNTNSYRYEEIPTEIIRAGLLRKCYLWYLENIKKKYY